MDKNPLEEETNNKILERKFGIAVKEEEKCELQEKRLSLVRKKGVFKCTGRNKKTVF